MHTANAAATKVPLVRAVVRVEGTDSIRGRSTVAIAYLSPEPAGAGLGLGGCHSFAEMYRIPD